MAVVLTFDLTTADINDYGRLKAMFERFGWESLGGSAYRYPRLGTHDRPIDDWLNHVVPALMLFRTYVTSRPDGTLQKFTIDTNSSSGYKRSTGFGSPPLVANEAAPYDPVNKGHFGKKNLRDWLDGLDFPY